MSERPRTGLSGNLHLLCAAHPDRGTYLAAQAFAAPMHLSKAYWDGEILIVNVINQTAGVFGGDCITSHVVVEPQARVLLTSPSAARFHPSHGREARLEQSLEVRAHGFLDVFPEISIPQRDSRSCQITMIHVERGGELIYLETLAPGRVASGEAFAFDKYSWSTDIHLAGRMVHRERACITPRDSSLASLAAFFPFSYYAGFVVISPTSESWKPDFAHAVSALDDHLGTRIGASKLCAGGWSIRVLAADSLALRQAIAQLRRLIYEHLGKSVPDPRRS